MLLLFDSYPLSRIDDCVDCVGYATFVSKINLLKGYWQVLLTARVSEISGFVTPDSFLNYKVMAFGMRNAPSTFQRLVNIMLSGMSGCETYLDDIVVHSTTWLEHLEQLRELFRRLANAKLTINFAKCEFGKPTITYLGRVVGRRQVLPVLAKASAVQDLPVPTDCRELHRFLGMTGYYLNFCKNFTSIVSPLTDLLSPKVKFEWIQTCQKVFESVKSLLLTAPVLTVPDFNKPFSLAVNASYVGVGAVLTQRGADNVDHPVSYFSQKFSTAQQKYSTIEK